MAKQKSSQPNEPAEEMASDAAELAHQSQQMATEASTSSEVVDITPEAYRQDIAVDLFRALAHGIRIQIDPRQSPASFAHYLLEVHAEMMKQAEACGIIPAAQPKDAE